MKVVGIIAEYNPFHNGHLYQLRRAKELTGADAAVIVMSGDFTQRGTPALVDKYARTRMALSCGADLVIELPVRYAASSAEYFAKGAISILGQLKVDALCFGSESGDLDRLTRIVAILSEESDAFKASLAAFQKQGLPYPAARSKALESSLPPDESSALLHSPNDILGIEYLKALKLSGYNMEVCTVLREGSGYLDVSLSPGAFSSALAIRESLQDKKPLSELKGTMPEETLAVLEESLAPGAFPVQDDFSSMLFYRLLQLSDTGYEEFLDVTPALSDKITKHLEHFTNWSSFASDYLKSKDMTLARLNRCLLHILLDIRKENMDIAPVSPYARILGFRQSSSEIFSRLSKEIPFISKLADARTLGLSKKAEQMLSEDIFAAHLYEQVLAQKKGGVPQNEYRRQIVIL